MVKEGHSKEGELFGVTKFILSKPSFFDMALMDLSITISKAAFSLYASKRKHVPVEMYSSFSVQKKEKYNLRNTYNDFVFLRRYPSKKGRTNEDLDMLLPFKIEDKNPPSKKLPIFSHDSFTTRSLILDNWIRNGRHFKDDLLVFQEQMMPSISPDNDLLNDIVGMNDVKILEGLGMCYFDKGGIASPSTKEIFEEKYSLMKKRGIE